MQFTRIASAACLIALASASHGIDLQPPFDPTRDTGLFVWRTWSGDWQMRALSADGNRRFSGSFTTGQAVSGHQGLSLEPLDVVRTSGSNTVEFDLRVTGGSVDGLRFAAGSGGVCLRLDASAPIHLGRDRLPAGAPVDLTSSGACGAAPAAAGAVEVLRTSPVDWRLRLAPAEGMHRFVGRLDFSEPVVAYSVASLEGSDQVSQPQPNRLTMRMEAWGGHYDQLNFTMSETSRICLRSTSGEQQVVSLRGKNQALRLRATTPVDLTNNGACGLPTDPFPPPLRGRKYHPGHYVVLTLQDDDATLAESLVQGVVGYVKRYTWRQLEPSLGNYAFAAIDADLATAAAFGVRLVVLIEDKSFHSGRIPTPQYLQSRTLPNAHGGHTVVRWDPYVVSRFKALLAALGRRFDSHPRLEGVALAESAHGLDGDAMAATGYTPERYRDVLIDELISASASLPRSRVFWFMNFLWGGNYYMGDIARAVAPHGVVMGGPDVLPDNVALNRHPYPFYDGALGKMPLFIQVEPMCYHHEHADPFAVNQYWSPEELFAFARDELHVNYLFWVRWRWRRFPESYNWWDAIPTIENHPTFNR